MIQRLVIERIKILIGLTSKKALDAFLEITKRNIIKLKDLGSIRIDSGSEFKNKFKKYMKEHNILLRTALPERHRQLANVESANKLIATILFAYMNNIETETGEDCNDWTDIIPELRKELKKKENLREDKDPFSYFPANVILGIPKYEIGDLVTYRLSKNQNALKKQIKGNNESNRLGDFLYSLHPKKIKQILFYPKNIRYVLEDLPQVSFAESEIQLWKEIEISQKIKDKIIKN